MSEIERYNGLTTADKGALLDAKARDDKFISLHGNTYIVRTCLAQIADMERAHMQDKKHCVTGFCADPKWLELANEYGWNFCPHCGNRLKAEVEA